MKQIPTSDFAGDDGRADSRLRDAMTQYADDGRTGPVLVALTGARLLVPVTAGPGEAEVGGDGLVRDKRADVAAVLLTGRDGRQALLAFTGLDALQRWRQDARPVPVHVDEAARSAVHAGAAALVLDVGGPAAFPIEGRALHDLAAGRRVVQTEQGYVWLQPVSGG